MVSLDYVDAFPSPGSPWNARTARPRRECFYTQRVTALTSTKADDIALALEQAIVSGEVAPGDGNAST